MKREIELRNTKFEAIGNILKSLTTNKHSNRYDQAVEIRRSLEDSGYEIIKSKK